MAPWAVMVFQLPSGRRSHCLTLVQFQRCRREEALAAITEAVTTYRDLAAARPAVFGSRLSSSLEVMANLLESMGRQSDADKARAEARQYQ